VRPRRRGALLRGPSTSPLDGMNNVIALPGLCALLLAPLAIIPPVVASAQSSSPDSPDVSMIVENTGVPFVTADFAKQLGTLVMHEKYPGVTFASSSPAIVDKGDIWWVTFTVKEWPKEMAKLRPALSDHLTLWIRKRDAAILAIR
jgi:hypothetical protein